MKLPLILPLALLAFAAPLSGQEADAPEAGSSAAADFSAIKLHPLFSKAARNLERPWECEISLELDSPNGPAKGSGHIRYFYQRMFSASFTIETGQAGATGRVDLQLLADEDFLYFSLDQGQGMAFAAKVSLSIFDRGPAELLNAAVAMDGGEASADLAGKLAAIEFEEQEVEGGKLTRLKADLTELLPAGEDRPGKIELSLDFDARTAFPRALQILAGDEGSLRLSVSDLNFPDDMDESQFEYQGPPAQDLTGPIQLALRQTGAEVEGES